MLFSCNKNDDENTSFTPQNITPTMISKGVLRGNGAENISQQNIVITNQIQFSNLITSMNTVNNVSNSFTETTVDFNNFIIIASFDSIRPNEGYSTNITNITENVDNIVVTVTTSYTPVLTAVVTQPFHIVKIPKSTKPIIFQ
jgi:hypothetical protein